MPPKTSLAVLDTLDQTSFHALLLNVVAAVGAASLMNGLIFSLGWDAPVDPAREPFFAPPGFVVGFVWMILFSLMAGARWRLSCAAAASPSASGELAARARVTTLILFCLAWPLYSLAIGSVVGGLSGCLVSLGLAVSATARAWTVSKATGSLLVPVVVWLLFATAIMVAELVAV